MSLVRCYIHAVWAVKFRDAVLTREMRPILVKSIHGILASLGQKPIITNNEPDHVHSIFRYFPNRKLLSDIMQAIKGGSSETLNRECFTKESPFRWQGGYGAFSVCPEHVKSKAQYVRDQETIHRERQWNQEYADMVRKCPPEELEENVTAEGERYVTHFEDLVWR